jgi:hypothetical protein
MLYVNEMCGAFIVEVCPAMAKENDPGFPSGVLIPAGAQTAPARVSWCAVE